MTRAVQTGKPKVYAFEGRQMTLRQIHEECVPILSIEAIRKHLNVGRNTRVAMLSLTQRRKPPNRNSKMLFGRATG